ncbi:MAG: S-layer homology domain-containing protein [Oscillospiraceae bacterium]|nr:S-layer homology domain-containing protein [Oscillospiraceae bacterium]
MKKILAMLLAVLMLSGCVASIGDAEMKADGTGSCTVQVGYSEAAVEQTRKFLEENEGDTTGFDAEFETLKPFVFDGIKFYGEEVNFAFEDPAELADTLNAIHGLENSTVDIGRFVFEQEGETLTLSLTVQESTGKISNEAMEVDPEMEEMLEDVRLVYTFRFFDKLEQTSGRKLDAFKIEDNTLTIDYIKLAEQAKEDEETFSFTVSNANIPTAKSASFPDVKQDDWFYDNVISMANAGLIVGRENGMFCPQDQMTKAEFITVAVRTYLGEARENLLFGKEDPWWDKYYTAAVSGWLIEEELFPREKMDLPLTREEMAQIALDLIVESYVDKELDTYTAYEKIPDRAEVDEAFKEAVAYCYADGILQGRDASGAFQPKAHMTRAEASTVMSRVLERIADANEEDSY